MNFYERSVNKTILHYLITKRKLLQLRTKKSLEIKKVDHVETNKIVSHNGLGFGNSNWHPFSDYAINQLKVQEDNFVLEKFYFLHQPLHAFQPIIPKYTKSTIYWQHPSFCYVFPWENKSVESTCKGIKISQIFENLDHKKYVRIKEGFSHQGPVNKDKIYIEKLRIKNLINFYTRSSLDKSKTITEPICGIKISKNRDYRVILLGGFHRLAVLTALGVNSIRVEIQLEIDLNALDFYDFYHVQTGLWTYDDVKFYLDSLFTFNSISWGRELIKP